MGRQTYHGEDVPSNGWSGLPKTLKPLVMYTLKDTS